MDSLQSDPKKFKWNDDGYPCNDCEYVAKRAYHLKRHVENKHTGVRHPCSECEFVATRADNLKIHVASKHNGVIYPCSQYEHAATTASDLWDMLKVNMKRWDILVLNASMLQLQ